MKPYPVYKESGIEWIGDVPEHWKFLSIKRVVSQKITDGPHETPEFLENGIPFISAEAIKNNKINFNLKRGNISYNLHQKYCKKVKPQKNDIFLLKPVQQQEI